MISHVYFIGIGGIGMSALARYFKGTGAFVAGYDRTPSAITSALEQEGVLIHYNDDTSQIPQTILEHPTDALVIYTPAIPIDHKEWNFLHQSGFKMVKRAQVLGEIAASKTCLAIAGTHGKTTTSTLLAHIFTHSGVGCTAFLGGISKNYQTNLLVSPSPYLVAEADEYDRSFLQLHPNMAVVTSIDADHLDIFGDYETLKDAFADFTNQINPNGTLLLKEGLALPAPNHPQTKRYRYSLQQESDFYASHLSIEQDGYYSFTLHLLQEVVPECRLFVPGQINIENGVAASAIAFLNGITPQQIKEALATFLGVSRRFDVQVNNRDCIYIDDYAHHPAEISAALNSIRSLYPNRKITAVFQPHLYTRTRDFADEFGKSLSLADELILLPIYPAREYPIHGVSSLMLLEKVTGEDKHLVEKENIVEFLTPRTIDVLITFGAGDIDRLVPEIKSLIQERR
ncbi:MAG: UDP-N-acetylmuramate--L-alanine ligase [Prevotellaceae bacterium]|jgi:UDP-N-acetylmuramate--alanine ligase|nr:UDP-N-acetylmuramate--L-alanine ligase [Prevotellaceae bacterium]